MEKLYPSNKVRFRHLYDKTGQRKNLRDLLFRHKF